MTDSLVIEAKSRLVEVIGQVFNTARDGLGFTRQLRAQAEPVLAITEGAQAEIERITRTQTELDDALSVLEPYRAINQIGALCNLLEAMKPLLAAMIAVEVARKALATIVIPSPNAIAAAGLIVAAREIETQIETAIRGVSDLLEA